MSDEIKVPIDDTEVDIAIAKLQQLISLSTQAFETPSIKKGAGMTQQEFKELSTDLWVINQLKEKDLPSINRELRLILGQIPGMREGISLYFRIKRLARGFELGEWQLYLSLLATAVLLIRTIMEYQRRLKLEEKNYERLIREYKDISHKEFQEMYKQEKSSRRRFPG